MSGERVRTRRRSVSGLTGLLAERLGIGSGEVAELLERLPFGEQTAESTPEVWQRPAARRLLERYAARKRAVARLASHGLL